MFETAETSRYVDMFMSLNAKMLRVGLNLKVLFQHPPLLQLKKVAQSSLHDCVLRVELCLTLKYEKITKDNEIRLGNIDM